MPEMERAPVKIVRLEDTLDPKLTTQVKKLLDVDVDVGALLASDPNDLDSNKISSEKNLYLKQVGRDNVQLLFNAVWELPAELYEDVVVAKLPKPVIVLPREKPVPIPKPPTKWEQYAKEKGIKMTKKSRLTWDEVLKKWVPRYGYKKAAAEKEKNWVIEVPESVDPYTDMFEKKAAKKQEKISKNEFQRLRNIAKAKNIKVPSMGLPPSNKLNSQQLNSAANIANVSTASLGKFQPKLSKEKQLNNSSILQQKKRKQPFLSPSEEHARNISLVDSVLRKKPKLDLSKAVNREINTQQLETHEEKKMKNSKVRGGGKKKEGRGKGAKRSKGKSFLKPKGGKGHIMKGGGRKRR
ncbi:ribosome biogenesis regulatory protein homolog [Cimex lectularius]|uniref:Ribosome biogenesis regulatory protein n=1 Tax=Cimex lectularius TaxID=79782 RepID=A0A8I6SEC7_CIMLE|nr:ribosome biogenesis regulatory protein homolog [Cimex lectularius]